jgi:hypothetical protein
MLLAVPVGALIKVLFVRYIDYRLEKKNGEEGEEKGEKDKKVQLERVQERKKI